MEYTWTGTIPAQEAFLQVPPVSLRSSSPKLRRSEGLSKKHYGLTQTLTQIAENRRGAKRNNLRVLGDFRPQKAWKALRCSGWRNRQQLITRRSLVQVQPPQPQKHRFPVGKRCFSLPFCNFWGRPHFLDIELTQTVTHTGQKMRLGAALPRQGFPAFEGLFFMFRGPMSGLSPWSWPPPSGPLW